jgi:SH3 domain protein
MLTDENATLKDSTRMDWFIRGAAVSLVAFLIGILMTRIRWKKQESWGSY